MKTVQETLKNTDAQLLIDTYLTKYPLDIDDLEPNQTVGEAEQATRQQLAAYLDRLTTLTAQPRRDQWLFYAYHHLENGIAEPSFALSPLSELAAQGEDAQSYSYIYSDQAEVMSFLVAENQLTKRCLTDLLVDIMHEAAFFGFNQEELAAARQRLDEASKEETVEFPQEWSELRAMPASDDFSKAEQEIVDQIHQLEVRIATNSRHNAIAEILSMQ